MARYTTEQTLSFGDTQDSRVLIVSGSVTVNAWDGSDWVLADTLTTGSYEYFTKNTRLKITPDVGSSFYIDRAGEA